MSVNFQNAFDYDPKKKNEKKLRISQNWYGFFIFLI